MGIIIAIVAYTLLGISLILDKVILKERVEGSSIAFMFWIGILGVIMLPLAFFGFHPPTFGIVVLGFMAGVLLLFAGRFYYGALERGEATQTPTIIGAFTPIATAFFSFALLNATLSSAEWIVFLVLVIGGFVMFFSEQMNGIKTLSWILGASVFYGLGNVLQKIVFSRTDFRTGLILYSFGMTVTALALLLRKKWRIAIIAHSTNAPRKKRALYVMSRLLTGIATLLILYAIKLEHPALVDALSGTRAVVAFLIALAVLKVRPKLLAEHFKGWELAGKVFGTAIIIVGLLGLGLERYYIALPLPPASSVEWGVTFSQKMSMNLGLDWRENFKAIVDELKPSGLRLIAYWDVLEPKQNEYMFQDLDWQMRGAEEAHIPVTLTIGQKVPRWPECHYPGWINPKETEVREKALLEYIAVIVVRYKNSPMLRYWQVENEPFLNFGECEPTNPAFIDKEITLVKSIDSIHPVVLTDGGEFGRWVEAAKRADVFGTTMYRKVYNSTFGYITYPITPEFFRLKKTVVQFLTGRPEQKFLVSELGMEPWEHLQIYEISVERQRELFSTSDFEANIKFARATGFNEYYFWGAEWWYFLKTTAGDPDYWNLAKSTIAHQ